MLFGFFSAYTVLFVALRIRSCLWSHPGHISFSITHNTFWDIIYSNFVTPNIIQEFWDLAVKLIPITINLSILLQIDNLDFHHNLDFHCQMWLVQHSSGLLDNAIPNTSVIQCNIYELEMVQNASQSFRVIFIVQE